MAPPPSLLPPAPAERGVGGRNTCRGSFLSCASRARADDHALRGLSRVGVPPRSKGRARSRVRAVRVDIPPVLCEETPRPAAVSRRGGRPRAAAGRPGRTHFAFGKPPRARPCGPKWRQQQERCLRAQPGACAAAVVALASPPWNWVGRAPTRAVRAPPARAAARERARERAGLSGPTRADSLNPGRPAPRTPAPAPPLEARVI